MLGRALLDTYPLPGEARRIAMLLESEGFHPQVRNELSRAALGELPVDATWAQVWVPTEELDACRRFLAQLVGDVSDEQVRCGACGEESPGHFAQCWSCQQPLSA